MRAGLHLPLPPGTRATLITWGNIVALGSAVAVFATGIILFTRFHVGPGALRLEWLGLSRLSWVNLHRLPSVVFFAACILHIALHWRPILARVQRLWPARPGRLTRWDAILYLGFSVVAVSGLLAWFLVPGSPHLWGPVIPTVLLPSRHGWIDVHNITGLVFLLAAVIHIQRHWPWFQSFLRRRWNRQRCNVR